MNKFLLNLKLPGLATIFFLALILRLAISVPFYSGDVNNHIVWGRSLAEDGFIGFYDRQHPNVVFPTYGPFGMIPFGASFFFFIFLVNFIWFLNLSIPPFPSNLVYFFSSENYNLLAATMKLSAIVGDLLVGLFIYFFAAHILKVKNPKIFTILYLFNPAVFYLSANWGQFDSLVLAFALASVYFIFVKRPFLSSSFFAASLLTKQTAVFFGPVFYILFLKTLGLKKTLLSVAISALILYFSYLPFGFLNPTNTFSFYFQTFFYVTDRVTENAFNLWYFVFAPGKPFDFEIFAGITHKIWGYLAFAIFAIPALFPLFKKINPKQVLTVLAFFLLASFLLLTRMHERYLAFLLPFPLLLSFNSPNFLWIYFGLSLIHLLNLYNGFFQPNIPIFNSLVGNLILVKLMIVLLFGILAYFGFKIFKYVKA